MHWVVQNNLLNPVDMASMREHLVRTGTPHTLVKMVPIFHMLMDPLPRIDGPVVVYGSTGMSKVASEHGFWPGYFGENLDHENYVKHFGRRMLNHDAVVAPLGSIEHRWDTFFLRPTLDLKSFGGQVMTWADLLNLRQGVQRLVGVPDVTLRPEDMVVMAPLKTIFAEYRLVAVDRRIITGSRYKLSNRVAISPDVPAHITAFAHGCAQAWQPSRAFVMDVAETDEGLRIVELNSFSSAGFYAGDMGAIIEAINAMDVVQPSSIAHPMDQATLRSSEQEMSERLSSLSSQLSDLHLAINEGMDGTLMDGLDER